MERRIPSVCYKSSGDLADGMGGDSRPSDRDSGLGFVFNIVRNYYTSSCIAVAILFV
jgi:hypothetical protein